MRRTEALGGGVSFVRWTGTLCWAVIAIVIVVAVALATLATVSEVVLPLVLAVVLAVLFAPAARWLGRRGWSPTYAALALVVGLVAVGSGVVLVTASTVGEQADTWSTHLDGAIEETAGVTDAAGVDSDDLGAARDQAAGLRPLVAGGLVTLLVSGVGTIVGFLAGAVLASLILYYLLKDGPEVRRRVVGAFAPATRPDVDAFVGRAAVTIRAYGAGRTVLSAAVAAVVTGWSLLIGLPMLGAIAVINFLGGYVPYVGAVIGGFVAVVLALAEGGPGAAVATLLVVLLANLALENFVEPRVMGNRLDVHPMAVLVVTTIGGVVGGIVGLILAVPLTLVGMDAVATARRRLLDSQYLERPAAER